MQPPKLDKYAEKKENHIYAYYCKYEYLLNV